MSGDEERKEKKRRRKRSRKNKASKNDNDYHHTDDAVEDKKEESASSNDKEEPTSSGINMKEGGEETPPAMDVVPAKQESDEPDDATAFEKSEEEAPPGPRRKRKRKRKSKQSTSNEADNDAGANINSDDKTRKLSSLDYTVYVEGIPFDCSEDDVKDFFLSNDCQDILQLRLPRWQDSGRLRGYGHVVFDSLESRTRAIETLSGKNMRTRYLTIQVPKAPRSDTTMGAMESRQVREQPEGCRTVHVKNLPFHATEQDIRQVFQVCGKILDGGVRIARNYQTRESKGFAYVEFKNPEGAQAAVNKAAKPFGMVVMGRPCFVDYDEGNIRGSFKTADGRLWRRQYGDDGSKQRRPG